MTLNITGFAGGISYACKALCSQHARETHKYSLPTAKYYYSLPVNGLYFLMVHCLFILSSYSRFLMYSAIRLVFFSTNM